jgi:hypothetical protein
MVWMSFFGAKGTIYWSWMFDFRLVSCRVCSGTSGFGPKASGLSSCNSWVFSGCSFSTFSGGLSYIVFGYVVWGGLVVYGVGDWGCGDGGCSVMMVDGKVLGSRSS